MAAPRPGFSKSAAEILWQIFDASTDAIHVVSDSQAATPAGNNNIGDVDVASIAAGETHIGEVSAPMVAVSSTPTLSVGGAAATGDYVGTSTAPQSFAGVSRVSGDEAVIKSITIVDKLTTAAVALELWLFSATITVPTDNDAWSITDAHALLCVGVIPIDASRWYASALNKVYCADDLALVVKPAAQAIFYALVARGTTPAWATGDLQITMGVLQ